MSWKPVGVVGGAWTEPFLPLAVDDYAVPDLALRCSFCAKDSNVGSVDFIAAGDRGSPFDQNIIPIGFQLYIVRTAFFMSVLAWDLFVHWPDSISGSLFLIIARREREGEYRSFIS